VAIAQVPVLLEFVDDLLLMLGERLEPGVECLKLGGGLVLVPPERHLLSVLDVAEAGGSHIGAHLRTDSCSGPLAAAQRDRRAYLQPAWVAR
jgi:hypothetical protein